MQKSVFLFLFLILVLGFGSSKIEAAPKGVQGTLVGQKSYTDSQGNAVVYLSRSEKQTRPAPDEYSINYGSPKISHH